GISQPSRANAAPSPASQARELSQVSLMTVIASMRPGSMRGQRPPISARLVAKPDAGSKADPWRGAPPDFDTAPLGSRPLPPCAAGEGVWAAKGKGPFSCLRPLPPCETAEKDRFRVALGILH